MTAAELKRYLRNCGCRFEEGAKHTLVRLGENSTILPRHPSKEVKTGTLNGILKELGLKGQKQDDTNEEKGA